MDRRVRQLAGAGATLALAAVGAAVAVVLSLPLALLVGPIIVLTVAAQRWPDLRVPAPLYGGALTVIGLTLGQHFTPELLATWRVIGASLVMNTVMTLLGTALGFVIMRRAFGVDPATAIFAGLPGGILTVMEVSREGNSDPGAVLFFQISRIILGATLIPLGFGLAGFNLPPGSPPGDESAVIWWELGVLAVAGLGLGMAGRRARFPSAEVSVPLLFSAMMYATGAVSTTMPPVLPSLAFVIVGAAIGTLLPRPGLRGLAVMGVQTVLLFTAFFALTLGATMLAGPALGISVPTGILTFSPAGLTEMVAIALSLDMDPALVAANNLYRMIFCSLLAPLILIGLRRRGLA